MSTNANRNIRSFDEYRIAKQMLGREQLAKGQKNGHFVGKSLSIRKDYFGKFSSIIRTISFWWHQVECLLLNSSNVLPLIGLASLVPLGKTHPINLWQEVGAFCIRLSEFSLVAGSFKRLAELEIWRRKIISIIQAHNFVIVKPQCRIIWPLFFIGGKLTMAKQIIIDFSTKVSRHFQRI